MAINPNTQYTPRITAPSAAYPYGSVKNETSPGADDGTPYELARGNDIFGMQQAILTLASIVPSGTADTALVSDYLEGLAELSSGRAVTYDDNSAGADVFVIDPETNQFGARSYFTGFRVSFIPLFSNTTTSTVDVNGLGVKTIANTAEANTIVAGRKVEFVYNGATFDIDLTPSNTEVTDYVSATKTYLDVDGGHPTSLSIESQVVVDTWESIGDAASSPDTIWTAMEAIPAGSKIAIVNVHILFTPTGPDRTATVEIFARQTGSSASAGLFTRIGFFQVAFDDFISSTALSVLAFVPLDSEGRFDVRWENSNSTTEDLSLVLKGFIGA